MASDTRESSKTIEGTVTENSDGPMVESMKVAGKQENNMELEPLLVKKERKREVNGKMERE